MYVAVLNESTKGAKCLGGMLPFHIHNLHTAVPCCTAITMQYNSYAMQFLYDEIKAEERCNKLQYSTVCRIS